MNNLTSFGNVLTTISQSIGNAVNRITVLEKTVKDLSETKVKGSDASTSSTNEQAIVEQVSTILTEQLTTTLTQIISKQINESLVILQRDLTNLTTTQIKDLSNGLSESLTLSITANLNKQFGNLDLTSLVVPPSQNVEEEPKIDDKVVDGKFIDNKVDDDKQPLENSVDLPEITSTISSDIVIEVSKKKEKTPVAKKAPATRGKKAVA